MVWWTDERRLALFSAGTIVRDPHHRESPTRREQVYLKSGMIYLKVGSLYTRLKQPLRGIELRKRRAKRLKRTGNLFGKNSERCLLILDLKPFRS